MKLPENTLIAYEKLTKYLLLPKEDDDKSLWLARAGYISENWKLLENDLRTQILPRDARPIENTKYGQRYEIRGKITGPNGKILSIRTIWMTETATGITKFITLFPDRRRKDDLQIV